MIRLPTFQERAKIATPNKAGTLLGVSPFSSSRNVMAKVQDTSSFIEAARAIHGDRYDYSQTDYVGANQPITIVCRKHGSFTLGWAASHYTKKGSGCQKCSGCEVKVRDTESFIAQSRLIHGDQYDYSLAKFSGCKKPVVIKCKVHGEFVLAEAQSHYGTKQCGCKSCTTEKRKSGEIGPRKTVTCHCGFTGSRYEFKTGSKLCKVCHAKQRREKYTVKCKGCDNRISKSLKKPYCSHECRNKHKPVQHQKLKVACCVCGTEVVRRVYGNQKTFCCSLYCQRQWSMKINKGCVGPDWITRSKKARATWKKQHRKQRLRVSEYWCWNVSIRNRIAKLNKRKREDAWVIAIRSRLSSAIGRDVVRKQHLSSSGSIEGAIARIFNKRSWFETNDWDKKLGNKLSSLSSRRRRKRNAKRIKNSGCEEETRGVALQMCFDWMADYA